METDTKKKGEAKQKMHCPLDDVDIEIAREAIGQLPLVDIPEFVERINWITPIHTGPDRREALRRALEPGQILYLALQLPLIESDIAILFLEKQDATVSAQGRVSLSRHWVVVILDVPVRTLVYFDTLGGPTDMTIVAPIIETIEQLEQAESPQQVFRLVSYNGPRLQQAGQECGLLTLYVVQLYLEARGSRFLETGLQLDQFDPQAAMNEITQGFLLPKMTLPAQQYNDFIEQLYTFYIGEEEEAAQAEQQQEEENKALVEQAMQLVPVEGEGGAESNMFAGLEEQEEFNLLPTYGTPISVETPFSQPTAPSGESEIETPFTPQEIAEAPAMSFFAPYPSLLPPINRPWSILRRQEQYELAKNQFQQNNPLYASDIEAYLPRADYVRYITYLSQAPLLPTQ